MGGPRPFDSPSILEESNSSQKLSMTSAEHKVNYSHVLLDSSSSKTNATIEDLKLARKTSRKIKKQKQCEAAEQKDKGSCHLLDNSSLKTDATTKEVNSSGKKKKKKKKQQGKAAEHKDGGPHFSVDNSSLKTDAIVEDLKLGCNQIGAEKKKRQCEAVGLKDKGSHFSLSNSSMNTDATSKEENSRRKRERERKKKKKEGKAVEHKKDKGSHVSLDNSSPKTDATTEELTSSRKRKRKRKRKKKKQVKTTGHKPEGFHLPADNSSFKTNATIEDPLHEPPAPTLLGSQETVELNLEKKNKKRKRKKTNHHAIENIVNSCGPTNDTLSSKTCTPALHRHPEHPIQFVSADPVREQSCVETDICQGKNEEKEHLIPIKVGENSNVECDVQELNCSHDTVVASAECSVLEVVELDKKHGIIDSNSNHSDNSDFEEEKKPKTKRKKTKHHAIDTRGNDIIRRAAGDVTDLSLVSKTGGQSEISLLALGRTITSKHYSKNKLLILDVNGLLADFATKVPKGSKPPDIYINDKKVYKRPFCDDFIQFCFDEFHVGVWSSRVKRNLDRAVRFLFGKSASKLLFCWNQSHCTKTKSFTLEDKHKPLVFKELRNLWDKTVPNLPWKKGEFNESNTLLLDDSPYKALLNPRYTATFPHPYHFDDTNDTALGCEGDLRVYLKGLAMAENVQEYVSSNPFGQEAITETHPSWDFYSEIIEAVRRCQNDAEIQATSSRLTRGRNQRSSATGQGTAGQPPSAIGAPPQQTEAPPTATRDPPQQTEALPLTATGGDPPQQTTAPPPPAARDSPQLTKALPPPATGDPQQTEVPPHATGDPPQQTKALLPPATATTATTAIPP